MTVRPTGNMFLRAAHRDSSQQIYANASFAADLDHLERCAQMEKTAQLMEAMQGKNA